jgi:hypothetical protein
MNPAIYYHPEAYTTSGPKLMGRNAAGESFLRGLLSYSKADTFWAQVNMTTIKIDDKEYDLDKLSDNAKAQLVSMQFCDQELGRLQAQAAALVVFMGGVNSHCFNDLLGGQLLTLSDFSLSHSKMVS